MRELNVKNDEVAEVSTQRSNQSRTLQLAEAHIRTTESRLRVEAQQRDLAVSMAREVGAGQAEVFQQYERARLERTAQAGCLSSAVANADRKVETLEVMLRETHLRAEEATQDLCPPSMCWREK